MKRYIARIKLDEKPLISLLCSGDKDYIIAFPKTSKILNEGGYSSQHFTLHTQNNRLTFKVTNFGNDKNNFKDILTEASEKDFYVSKNTDGTFKDIDLTKGERYLKLDDPKVFENFCVYGINDIHNKESRIDNFFEEARSSDEDFKKIVNIESQKYSKDIEVRINICKNAICNPKRVEKKYKNVYMVEDSLGNNKYTFSILILNRR